MIAFSPKPAGSEQYYIWSPALVDGDGISSFMLTGTGVTVSSSQQVEDGIGMYLFGGSSGTVATIAATAITSFGETLTETIYVPISGPGNSFTDTAQDVVDFALRPIVGISGTATTDERADALEWLNGMLAQWAVQGADTGVVVPLALSDTIYANDSWVLAIKNNLRVYVAEQYGRQVAPATLMAANRGLGVIKNARRSIEPLRAEYY